MTQQMKDKMAETIRGFRLPRYEEIPNMGLYLEQVAKYINDILAPLGGAGLTCSMISNYVKKGLVDNPVRKLYYREQIAYLVFISVVKNVLSLDNIRTLNGIQKQTYTARRAYDYFCEELENILFLVFGLKEQPATVGTDSSDEKMILRNAIITVAHQTYLDAVFRVLGSQPAEK